jgi:hypothetical protein
MDLKVGWARAQVTLRQSEIERVEEKALPPGFWDPPGEEAGEAPGAPFRADQAAYLEVPIIGAFGKEVFVEAVARALAYAKRRAVKHVVFVIDNVVEEGGGDVDHAMEVYNVLKRYADSLHYHGLVRNCLGDGLAAALWCDTVRLLPGSRIGGVLRKEDVTASEEEAAQREIVRSQLVAQVIEETRMNEIRTRLVRAMVIPSETLAFWRDEKGQVQAGPRPPEGLPAGRLLLEVKRGELLQLAYEQAVTLGMPAYTGGARELGEHLGIPGWVSAGDFGIRAAADARAKNERREQNRQSAFERKGERLITRRETVEKYIADHVARAAEFDPTENPYDAYRRRWHWGWGWSGSGGSGSSVSWTEETSQTIPRTVQRQWTQRADNSIQHLQLAARGLQSMKSLEKEAVEMGLQPAYAEGEIDALLADLAKKVEYLKERRDPFTPK